MLYFLIDMYAYYHLLITKDCGSQITGQFGEITYSLVGDLSRYFNIDPENGIITVNNVSFFDHEQRTEARLTVIATDKAPIATRHTTAVPVGVY